MNYGPGPQPRSPRIVPTLPASGPAGDFIFSVADDVSYIANNAGSYQVLDTGTGDVTASGTLTANRIILGAGTTVVTALGSLGTTTTVLHGNAAGAPTFGAVSLSADVSGDLPFANFVQASAASKLVGRGSAAGAGDFEEITLGSNLTMTGTTLAAAGGATINSTDGVIPYRSSSSAFADSPITRADANTVKVQNGTNIGRFDVYGNGPITSLYSQGTDTSVVEGSGGSQLSIRGGTYLTFYIGGAQKVYLDSANLNFQGVGLTFTDNSQDIGASGASRPRTGYFGTSVIAPNLGSALSCLVSNTALSQATGTVYSSPGYGGTPLAAATEAAVGWAVPRVGTISALQVYSGTVAKVNTPATTVTVRKNGVDTALTLAMTQTVSTLTADNTHSFTVALGDIITVSFTTTGAAAVSTSIAGVSFLLS